MRHVFQIECRPPEPLPPLEPLEQFAITNTQHPDMDEFLAAFERQDAEQFEEFMWRVSVDGWRRYLKSAHKGGARLCSRT